MSEYSAPTSFIDLGAQQKLIRDKLESAIITVLDHGQYIMGPEVKTFEARLKSFVGAEHAITCANGTDALSLVLMAWGVGAGDAVFVPSFTYVASAEAPAQLGATPFFVDVCEKTFNIDPESLKQAIMDSRLAGLTPKAVVAVDLFGQPCDIDTITEISKNEGIKVLVDGAQSFGAETLGRRVGSLGDATTTSFFPAKPFGCYGDGGAIFTDDDTVAGLIESIRLHGRGDDKYDNVRIGINSRLDTLQAAILLEKLELFPDELQSRTSAAMRYHELLSGHVDVPSLMPSVTSSWAQYTVKINERSRVQAAMRKLGIPTVIYYPIPLSKQTGYRKYPVVTTGVQVSEALAERVLSIPMHPYLTPEVQVRISDALIKSAQD